MDTTPFSSASVSPNDGLSSLSPTRTYYPRTGVTVAVLVITLIGSLGMAGGAVYLKIASPKILKDVSIALVFVVGALLLVGAAIYIYQGLTTSRLTLSPEGIEFSTSTHSLKTSWKNAISIGTVPVGNTTMTGLLVNSSEDEIIQVKPYMKGFLAAQPVVFMLSALSGSYNPMLSGDFSRVIPLSQFQPHWKTNELGDLIRRYAPWVLDEKLAPGEYGNSANLLPQTAPPRPAMKPLPVKLVFAVMLGLNMAAFLYVFLAK